MICSRIKGIIEVKTYIVVWKKPDFAQKKSVRKKHVLYIGLRVILLHINFEMIC